MKKRMGHVLSGFMTMLLLLLLPLSAAAEAAAPTVSVVGAPIGLLLGIGIVSLACIGAAVAYKRAE